jgi:hypothetical protein
MKKKEAGTIKKPGWCRGVLHAYIHAPPPSSLLLLQIAGLDR